jgi:hypothetical protein
MSGHRHHSPQGYEEPRTMGDESFEEWMDTMGGIDEGGQRGRGIPALSSRWAYENWVNKAYDRDLRGETANWVDRGYNREFRAVSPVQRYPGSRIPVAYTSGQTGAVCPCAQPAEGRPSRLPIPTAEGYSRRGQRRASSSSSSGSSSDEECRYKYRYPPTKIPKPTYTQTTRRA